LIESLRLRVGPTTTRLASTKSNPTTVNIAVCRARAPLLGLCRYSSLPRENSHYEKIGRPPRRSIGDLVNVNDATKERPTSGKAHIASVVVHLLGRSTRAPRPILSRSSDGRGSAPTLTSRQGQIQRLQKKIADARQRVSNLSSWFEVDVDDADATGGTGIRTRDFGSRFQKSPGRQQESQVSSLHRGLRSKRCRASVGIDEQITQAGITIEWRQEGPRREGADLKTAPGW